MNKYDYMTNIKQDHNIKSNLGQQCDNGVGQQVVACQAVVSLKSFVYVLNRFHPGPRFRFKTLFTKHQIRLFQTTHTSLRIAAQICTLQV